MRTPPLPKQLIWFAAVLAVLLVLVQLEVLRIAFDKLGLSPSGAFLLLFVSLIGSVINLPLFSIRAERPAEDEIPEPYRELLRLARQKFTGRTWIALNVGGCVIPVSFSAYLFVVHQLASLQAITAIALVALVCHLVSRPIPGLGIGMPIFVAPVTAALVALTINPEQSAPLAYLGGTLGVLIGADIARLPDIRRIGAPVAAIGGAGTFDGIFITGVVAVLLA